jgi:hypothetical protein
VRQKRVRCRGCKGRASWGGAIEPISRRRERDSMERPYFRLGAKTSAMNFCFSPLFGTVVLTGQGHLVKSSMLSITAKVILLSSFGQEVK